MAEVVAELLDDDDLASATLWSEIAPIETSRWSSGPSAQDEHDDHNEKDEADEASADDDPRCK
jgi:hypothetical protein